MSTCLIMSEINEIAPCRHGVTQELSNLSWETSDASGWQITRSEEPCRPFSARICWHVLNNVTMCNPSITSGPTQQVKSSTFYFIVYFLESQKTAPLHLAGPKLSPTSTEFCPEGDDKIAPSAWLLWLG